jgi:hypothetical protein
MNSNKRVYRAHIHERFSPEDGISVFCHYGHLSPCGQWVDGGEVQWRRTQEWCDTEAEAKALLAGRIAEIGARLLRQSAELLQAARAEEVIA